MNKEFLDVLQRNTLSTQKYFYDNLSSKYSQCSGHIIGYKRLEDDDDNYLKIRKTELDINDVSKELKNKFTIVFIQKTDYLRCCKNIVKILFTYAKTKRYLKSENKYEEWFNFNHNISIPKIVSTLVSMMKNTHNISIPINIKQYKYTDSDTQIISKTSNNDSDDDDEFFKGVMVGVGGLLIGGLIVGAIALLCDDDNSKNKSNEIPYVAKKGDISDNIFKLLSLENGEYPMYYYACSNIHIILTNRRFVKIENLSIVSNIYLNNIIIARHIKNSILYFDNVEIVNKNNIIETVGIYDKTVCAYFTNLLIIMIKNIKDMKPLLYPMLYDKDFSYSYMITPNIIQPIEVKEKCFRCLDNMVSSFVKINCKHTNICQQCVSVLDKCPTCFVKYN